MQSETAGAEDAPIVHVVGHHLPAQYVHEGSSSCTLRQTCVMKESKADKDDWEICFKTVHQIPTEKGNED